MVALGLTTGVLVCREGEITWRTVGDHVPVRIQIPRRLDALRDNRPTIINAWCMHKRKRDFFFLLQVRGSRDIGWGLAPGSWLNID
jgi:hypothetical protein